VDEDLEREVRRREANWEEIERLPTKLKEAVIFYIEHGDEYVASRIAGISLEEFEELRIRLRIPKVVVVED